MKGFLDSGTVTKSGDDAEGDADGDGSGDGIEHKQVVVLVCKHRVTRFIRVFRAKM